MIPGGINEIWFVLIYSALTWAVFSLALYLADNLHRRKEAMLGGLLILVLSSVLAMLSSFAAMQLGSGIELSAIFLLVGTAACSMAVSRVMQMLSWLRTWLAAIYAVVGYVLVSLILGWVVAMLMQ